MGVLSLHCAPRVALFTDSFEEANGVATLSRNLVEFAQQQQLPFMCFYGGGQTKVTQEGSLATVQLKRGWSTFPLSRDLSCDPLLMKRHRSFAVEQLRSFKADLVHINGPSDLGFLGFWAAHILRIPLAASWHTNLHEYAALRLDQAFRLLPAAMREWLTRKTESQSLRALMRFYKMPRFLMAPNQDMADLLHQRTGRPAFLMGHGVDIERFVPKTYQAQDRPFCIGYVGRLSPEKNVRYFAELERKLIDAGESSFRFLLVGEGSEQTWLKRNLQRAHLTGVLRGDKLAEAYASMDVLVFPSQTDTFGLVLLEAMASGVPVVLGRAAGVRAGIVHAQGGYLEDDLINGVLRLMHSDGLQREMAAAARRFACSNSWPDVFRNLYRTYGRGLEIVDLRRINREKRKAGLL